MIVDEEDVRLHGRRRSGRTQWTPDAFEANHADFIGSHDLYTNPCEGLLLEWLRHGEQKTPSKSVATLKTCVAHVLLQQH